MSSMQIKLGVATNKLIPTAEKNFCAKTSINDE
jgi:hypothetical protein